MKHGKNLRCFCLLVIFIILAATTPPVLAGDGVTRYWGVIAGISDYQNYDENGDLLFAADDAIFLYNLLLGDSFWDVSRINLLTNSQAYRSAVLNSITTMAGNSDDDDVFLFFFSGHGGQADRDFYPVDETDNVDEYLVCWDSNPTDFSGDLIDDDLGDALGQIDGKKIILIDACFSGGNIKSAAKETVSKNVLNTHKIKFLKKPFVPHVDITIKGDGFASDLFNPSRTKDSGDQSNIIILTASNDNEVSYENIELRHGDFTYFLILGLKSYDINRNRHVSAEETYEYLYPAIEEYRKSTVTPQKYDGISGEVDILEPVAERLVFIGHGDFTWNYPFNTYYQKRRAEYIYYPSQLGPEGYVKTLKIFVAEIPQLTLNNCTIRMKHTTQSEYDAPPQWTSSGWETVFSGTYTVGTLGPVSFTLLTPFHYDGVSNLIIDFSFSNSGLEDSGFFWSSFSDTYSMIYHSRDDDVYGEPLNWTDASPLPIRDDNPTSYAGSYLDLELEFFTKQGFAMPWIPLLLIDE